MNRNLQKKCNKKGRATLPNAKSAAGLSHVPDDNVDQDGRCLLPAHGESAGLNTGDPCDDGRSGK